MVGRVGLFLHAITVLLGVVGAISANDKDCKRSEAKRSFGYNLYRSVPHTLHNSSVMPPAQLQTAPNLDEASGSGGK